MPDDDEGDAPMMTPKHVLSQWLATGKAPEGWAVEIDDSEQGGQPNAIWEVEENSEREWYSLERETHRRAHLEVIVTGPWMEGPREWVAEQQEAQRAHAERERRDAEDQILVQAGLIRERREREGS